MQRTCEHMCSTPMQRTSLFWPRKTWVVWGAWSITGRSARITSIKSQNAKRAMNQLDWKCEQWISSIANQQPQSKTNGICWNWPTLECYIKKIMGTIGRTDHTAPAVTDITDMLTAAGFISRRSRAAAASIARRGFRASSPIHESMEIGECGGSAPTPEKTRVGVVGAENGEDWSILSQNGIRIDQSWYAQTWSLWMIERSFKLHFSIASWSFTK